MPSLTRVDRTLYRLLLRIARVFDVNPAYKSVVFLPALHSQAAAASGEITAARILALARSNWTCGKPYAPSDGSLSEYIRTCFESSALLKAAGGDKDILTAAAIAAQSELMRIATLIRPCLDGASAALTLPPLDIAGSLGSNATLEHGQAVDLGSLLIDHPAAEFPGHAIHVVYDIDQHVEEADGDNALEVRALCINRPLPHRVKDAFPDMDLGSLGDLHLWYGGGRSSELYALHCFPDLKDAVEVHSSGLYIGGSLTELQERIADGRADVGDIKILAGYESWKGEPGAQPAGMETLVPAIGSAVSAMALMPAVVPEPEALAAISTSEQQAESMASEQNPAKSDVQTHLYEHEKFWHQNVTWSAAMTLLGDEWADMAAVHPMMVQLLYMVAAAPDSFEITVPQSVRDSLTVPPAARE